MANIFKLFSNRHARSSANRGELEKLLAPFKRNAWYPIVEKRTSPPDSSKFSGIPMLALNEDWPLCKHCGKPMQLFLQLDAKELPADAGTPFGEGYLQVFYCTNQEHECESECEAYFPFSQSTLVRVLDFASAQSPGIADSPVLDAFPEKVITGWNQKPDYPNWEELEELGCSLTDDQCEALDEAGYPLPQDKLLGWPYWVQGIEYPDCPECGKRMKFVFQLDSEDNLPYMFGDTGCSHITQCEDHKDRMAIAWACC